MVVFSFYRGNLHRVPDIPRKWTVPKPSISLQTFRILLNKREEALRQLRSQGQNDAINGNGNDAALSGKKRKRQPDDTEKDIDMDDAEDPKLDANSMDCDPPLVEKCPSQIESENAKQEDQGDREKGLRDASETAPSPHNVPLQQASDNPDANTEQMKRKLQLEAKLKELTEEKHHLVQMLKQILSNEEEMKKKGQMAGQSSVTHAFCPQGESMPEGSQVRQFARNVHGDLEEGELEDTCTPSHYSHIMHHVHGFHGSGIGRQQTSLQHSSQSPQQFKSSLATNVHGLNNINVSLGAPSSPSPRGVYGSQGQHSHLPQLSISMTQAMASSPSPAGSSGTSIFREMKRTSPSWNQR
eukprot:TRINITY_DN19589_c0_g1_i1.p1 TRINITY_DN19589_c0_g1~~TRINITY_DN19589_c0_g1_i1.p1  ORF type:complete len:371 (-),score=71.68 TRINITY_DN19589_c0_g1_i1:363-1427(-)